VDIARTEAFRRRSSSCPSNKFVFSRLGRCPFFFHAFLNEGRPAFVVEDAYRVGSPPCGLVGQVLYPTCVFADTGTVNEQGGSQVPPSAPRKIAASNGSDVLPCIASHGSCALWWGISSKPAPSVLIAPAQPVPFSCTPPPFFAAVDLRCMGTRKGSGMNPNLTLRLRSA